jgi:hypothetical protein
MRTTAIFCILLIAAFACCKQEKKSPLEGTWAMVSGKWTLTDSTKVYTFPGNITSGGQLCTYSKNYYLFSGQFKMKDDSVSHSNYGAGTYTYDGTKYEESLIYFVDAKSNGQKYSFKLVLKNDTLTKTGPLEGGEKRLGDSLIEVYVRKD